jgi:hypothetical protein
MASAMEVDGGGGGGFPLDGGHQHSGSLPTRGGGGMSSVEGFEPWVPSVRRQHLELEVGVAPRAGGYVEVNPKP